MTKEERAKRKVALTQNFAMQVTALRQAAYRTGSLDSSPGYRGKDEAARTARAAMEEADKAVQDSFEEIMALVPA